MVLIIESKILFPKSVIIVSNLVETPTDKANAFLLNSTMSIAQINAIHDDL